METDKTKKRIRKTKEEILKKVKVLILIGEIVNKDIEKTAKSVKNSEEAVEAVNNMEKIIKSSKCNILWLAYQQDQIFEKFKMNEIVIDMVKELEISKSTIEYPRMKVFTFSSVSKE